MRTRIFLPLSLGLALLAQIPRPEHQSTEPPDEPRLPNGKLQSEEILRVEFEKSLQDSRQLVKLAGELQSDLEKNDRHVLSLQTLKRTEEIEKLAKRIHDRMKHF